MSIITLTTDWKKNDYYTGAIKGAILSQCPTARIMDISHQVDPFNTAQGAFILRNCYHFYPDDTIHIISINSTQTKNQENLLIYTAGQYFIGPDNGMFSLIFGNNKEMNIYRLNSFEESAGTFPALYLFADAACKLINGTEPKHIGTASEEYNKQTPLRPTIDESGITGSVVYIDSYKNAITNISQTFFEQHQQQRPFEILIQSNHYRIKNISKYYGEVPVGELVALFNSAGLLEIAINSGNAADLLNLNTNSSIRIRFQ